MPTKIFSFSAVAVLIKIFSKGLINYEELQMVSLLQESWMDPPGEELDGQKAEGKHVIPSLTRFLSPSIAALQRKHFLRAGQEVPFTTDQEKCSA